MKLEKTYHRWTSEEDDKLVDAVQSMKALFQKVGTTEGVPIAVLWSQIPGRIGVLATPLACSMRYRTLTSHSDWATRRRKELGLQAKIEQSTIDEFEDGENPTQIEQNEAQRYNLLANELREVKDAMFEMRDLMKSMLDVWRPSPIPERELRAGMQ